MSWGSRKSGSDTIRYPITQRDPEAVDTERRKMEAEMSEYECARCGAVILGTQIGASFEGKCVCKPCISEFEVKEEEIEVEQPKQSPVQSSPEANFLGFLKEKVEGDE
jgi:hypothetical protein